MQKKKRGKHLNPRNRKARLSISTALLQSVAEIGIHSTMKSNRKTMHEFSPHIPHKTPKRNISRSTDEMLHTDITRERRVGSTHAREATNCHQNS
jgi:hypothetical protein